MVKYRAIQAISSFSFRDKRTKSKYWRPLHPHCKWSTLDTALVHRFNLDSSWRCNASCATLVYWSVWHQHNKNSHLKKTFSANEITNVDGGIPRLERLVRLSSKSSEQKFCVLPWRRYYAGGFFLHMMNMKQTPLKALWFSIHPCIWFIDFVLWY